MWLYGQKLFNDQLILTKDRLIKFVPILYEPKLPIMDYSKDSKLELIFLGHIEGRPKYKGNMLSLFKILNVFMIYGIINLIIILLRIIDVSF